MPQTPALLLSTLVALAYGATYHLFRGKRLSDLPVFLLAALLGFACGWLAAAQLELLPPTLGEIHLVEASLASGLFLVAADWLRTRGPSS